MAGRAFLVMVAAEEGLEEREKPFIAILGAGDRGGGSSFEGDILGVRL